jgi:threonine dehydrogenase-like Zn-dependent dehydrogenase
MLLDRHAIYMTAPCESEYAFRPLSYDGLGPGELLMETEYSVISAGTELAIYQGGEWWAHLPYEPGYGALGHVLEVGSNIKDVAVGDRVFTYTSHASINVVRDGRYVKVPDGVDPLLATVGARMGQIAFTSLRVSHEELGDFVVVQGLGLVGNLAAQLFTLSGCKVIGLDISPSRLETARACGISHTIDTSRSDAAAEIARITDGGMAQVVVEATGVPGLVATAACYAAIDAEVILLGSPRGEFVGDATDLLYKVHHAKPHITLKGALEWIYPFKPTQGCKHNLERNVKQLIQLVGENKLHVRELISHVVSPADVPGVYKELLARNQDYFGVAIDWRKQA